MSTNHWKIIIDNFPKYFSEKVTFLYGFETACRAIAHMRGMWAHEHGTEVTAIPTLYLHGQLDSQIEIPMTIASGNLTTYAKFPTEYKVELDTLPTLHCYGKFPNEYQFITNILAATRVNGRYNSEAQVQVDVLPRLRLKGKIDTQSAVQMEIKTLVTNLYGATDIQYQVDVDAEGFLYAKGKTASEYFIQMNVAAIVATFYKLYEQNEKTLATVNDLTLNDFCIKTIS